MLTIWTYDFVPGGENGPRGFVRDLRLRWVCEEAALDYVVKTTPPDRREFGRLDDLVDLLRSHVDQVEKTINPLETV